MRTFQLPETTSTMTWLECSPHCHDNNILVTATYQTQSIGRGKNLWVSEEGNLLMTGSVHYHDDNFQTLALHISSLIIQTLRTYYKSNFRIKWPNDIILDNYKVGGVLIRSHPHPRQNCYVLHIGIGLNTNSPVIVPNRPQWPASSVIEITRHRTDNPNLASTIMEEIQHGLHTPFNLSQYRDLLLFRSNQFFELREVGVVQFVRIARNGALCYRRQNSTLVEEISSGEIITS